MYNSFFVFGARGLEEETGDLPANDYDCTLACLSNAPTYGATMAGVDNFEEKQSTIGSSVAVHEYFMLTAFATEQEFYSGAKSQA